MVGGKETGQKMTDYIIPDGPFTKAFAKLAATGWRLNLQSAHRPGAKGAVNSKTKFTCSQCGQNAWGKPDLAITYFYLAGGGGISLKNQWLTVAARLPPKDAKLHFFRTPC
jgi:hypothetical protein